MNGNRLPAEEAHQLRLGDSIQLGVPLLGNKVEFDYILVRRPLKDIKTWLAKGHRVAANTAAKLKRPKRKFSVEEVEPSTSSKPKLYRCSSSDKSFAQPCPLAAVGQQQRPSPIWTKESGPSKPAQEVDQPSDVSSRPSDLDNLQMYVTLS